MKIKNYNFVFLGALLWSSQLLAQGGFTSSLFIPDTISNDTVHIYLRDTTHEFVSGVQTATYGMNASYLGPTIFMNVGDHMYMNVHNELDETTTMHWHGMHVAPEDDGGPHTAILAGETWQPDFEVIEEATTFWYHPHLHEKTNEQVSKGAAGMIIIRDEEEASLTLPRTYGVDDIPLIIQSKAFNDNWQIQTGGGAEDSTMMVNGVIEPYAEVPAQMVRFRMLNASSARTYNIGISDDRTFYQIGSDGGLLNAPVSLDRIIVSPGERMEFVVDFSGDENETLYLMSYASEFRGGITGGGPPPGQTATNPLDGADFEIMEFRVGAATGNAITSLPNTMNDLVAFDEADVDVTRTITLDGGDGPGDPFTIDGQEMDMMRIDQTVMLDDIEIWEIYNDTRVAHPFHIHDIQFYILDRDGETPPANERGRKDVVFVYEGETVRFITKFDDFANDSIPYMYHCHILAHEDGGMMGQFVVVDSSMVNISVLEKNADGWSIYPNPASEIVQVKDWNGEEVTISNLEGKVLLTAMSDEIDISDIPAGLYVLSLETEVKEVLYKKLMIE